MKYVKTNYFFIQNKFQLQDELRRPFLYLFHVYNSPSRRLCRFDVAIPSVYFSSTIIKFTKLCIFAHFGPRLKCNSRLYISSPSCNLKIFNCSNNDLLNYNYINLQKRLQFSILINQNENRIHLFVQII